MSATPPRVLLRSSADTLDVAHAMQSDLGHDFDVVVWCEGTDDYSIFERLSDFDAAIAVLSSTDLDDRVRRNRPLRPNVMFELGLFVGRFGAERTFVISTRDARGIKPLDAIDDVTRIVFDRSRPNPLESFLQSTCGQIRHSLSDLVFQQSERSALRTIVQPSPPTVIESTPRRVFLSYAAHDRKLAEQLTDRLAQLTATPWFDRWELKHGEPWRHEFSDRIRSTDIVVFLLSENAVSSRWLGDVSWVSELEERAVTFIPARIDGCHVPSAFASHHLWDLSVDLDHSLSGFARKLKAAPSVDLSSLDWRTFEQLVADLLREQGFSVSRSKADRSFEFIATTAARTHGLDQPEKWLVEAKFYSRERVSVASLRKVIGDLATATDASRAMIVTNGRLTSVARRYLADEVKRTKSEIRLIDGTELTELIVRFPALVQRYFKVPRP